ncbi:YdiU family protein [Candidatus Sulfurimonas marisnigri]|uniref:Protein nucleotidyltransferase YdiU n=1 Tax=Candidatus Sulfurimonas marisnigri TaxID=2740405 RepID=A0A7S7LZU3_9BACT|nr:YdiU family protein [Candidatus Sulfurimonas marisnigri]QOY53599.1 YdiU family protein [Candidatus Sulfurimonas marisnigri]
MILDNMILQTTYLSLDSEFYDLTDPTPLDEPYLISFNPEAAKLIDLDSNSCNDPDFVALLNGTFIPKGSRPFAMCYAGHQFGNYNPWLGDGRTINLGSVNGWNLQLKGSGETLYSRMADGRAVVRSSIREYLMSEGMHHLGIPSTRALGIIGSKTKVIRNSIEQAAIVMRMSTSWVRFGTFEYFYYRREYSKLEMLTEYVIVESYPHFKDDDDRFFKMFCEVVERTAKLIAQWQAIGFNHGVMNTDNMSIEGLTIDYGPFAMLDDFRYGYICNHTDRAGRYSYGEQPNISYWNLTMLSKALSPIISKERMQQKLDDFGAFIYPNAYVDIMRDKLGLSMKLDDDALLIEELVETLHNVFVDHTLFFRTLSRYNGDKTPLYDIVMEPVILDKWLKLYDDRLSQETRTQSQRQKEMLNSNPKYILKNYMLQKAITQAEGGDYSMVETLLYIAAHPYDELPEFEHFAGDTPEEYKNLGLSCSS